MNSIDFVSATVAIKGLTYPLVQYATQAEDIIKECPEVEPEITAASKHVADALEAILRANLFLTAKFEANYGDIQ